MDATFSESRFELRSKTYLKALGFILPAIIIWEAICFKCVPILVTLLENSGADLGGARGFWAFSMFFVHHGISIFVGIVLALALCERFSQGWQRYRRSAVVGMAWLLNTLVIASLASLITATLIIFPSLLK